MVFVLINSLYFTAVIKKCRWTIPRQIFIGSFDIIVSGLISRYVLIHTFNAWSMCVDFICRVLSCFVYFASLLIECKMYVFCKKPWNHFFWQWNGDTQVSSLRFLSHSQRVKIWERNTIQKIIICVVYWGIFTVNSKLHHLRKYNIILEPLFYKN